MRSPDFHGATFDDVLAGTALDGASTPGAPHDADRPDPTDAGESPDRSRLLASLSTLILLWDSPALQGEILAKSGETLDQSAHEALRHLLAWGPIRPSVLAEALGTGASNVSKIVARLEQDGRVHRASDEIDGRACVVTLTDRGEAAAHEVYALGDRMISEVLEKWSFDDVRRYTALTERFVTNAITSSMRMRERGVREPE